MAMRRVLARVSGAARRAVSRPLGYSMIKIVEDPPSEDIAVKLSLARAFVCEHGRNPCNQYCGVRARNVAELPPKVTIVGDMRLYETRGTLLGFWEVIPYADRVAWAARVNAISASG